MEAYEIDLREQIGNEIQAEIDRLDLTEEERWGMSKAIGVLRAKIWHNATCPCARCDVNFRAKCVICAESANRTFFGKKLCEHHYELSRH